MKGEEEERVLRTAYKPRHVCAERVEVILVFVLLIEQLSSLLAEVKLFAHGHLEPSLPDFAKYFI